MQLIPKVDSALIFIPLEECEILCPNLRANIAVVNMETGEQLEIKEGYAYHSIELGVTFRITTQYQFNGLQLAVLINSKQLTTDYFKGITTETFEQLYSVIMGLNIFKCSYETFKNASYTDVDIAVDFNISLDNFPTFCENILGVVKNRAEWQFLNKPTNKGIWTPKGKNPRNNATPAKPYVKAYHKKIDFENKSMEFAEKYFKPSDYENVARIECTVKNAKHRKRLGISSTKTIFEFLNLDLQSIQQTMFKEYVLVNEKPIVTRTDLTPMDKQQLALIKALIAKGATRNEIYALYTLENDPSISAQQRSRMRAKWHEMIDQELHKQNIEITTLATNNVLEYLGVNTQLELKI